MGRTRIAVVGAGEMARRRARAFVRTGRAEIVGVASRRASTARRFGDELGCPTHLDDFRQLAATAPDAVLVEVPNAVQQAVVTWALGCGLHTLIGGPLACSVRQADAICALAHSRRLVVEAGYEARYKAVWETAKRLVAEGAIGRVAAVRTTSLWDCDPMSWYGSEQDTGGMPVAHMTYAFINPLRWIFGEPTHVAAFANRLRMGTPGSVREETCVANLLFPESVLCSMLASFLRPFVPPSEPADSSWSLCVLGTAGAIDLYPTELDGGCMTVRRGTQVETVDMSAGPDAFEVQAEAFLDSLAGPSSCRNPPESTVGDLRVAEAIVRSARRGATVRL